MKKLKRKLHLSDEGFSLMELIITMLVSAIVTAAAAGFLVAGVQFYNRANAETTIQKESQVAEFFLTELIQESVDYKEIPASEYPAGEGVNYAMEVTRKDDSGNNVISLVVWKDRELWYAIVPSTATDDTSKITAVLDEEKPNAFLADCVMSFFVQPTSKGLADDGNGLVQIQIGFEEANKTYLETATVSLRNRKRN